MARTAASKGVATGDLGIGRDGQPTDPISPAWNCTPNRRYSPKVAAARSTKTLFERFKLREGADPQTYGIGIKELWEVDPRQASAPASSCTPSAGRSTTRPTAARSSITSRTIRCAVGFVVGLGLSAIRTSIRSRNSSASRLIPRSARPSKAAGASAYGARALSEGGFQSLPKLTFPGRLLVGDTAGFLNVPKIKGTHTAMKSGMTRRGGGIRTLCRAGGGAEVVGLSGTPAAQLAVGRAVSGAQYPAVVSLGPLGAVCLLGAGYLSCCAARRHGRCTTTPTTHSCSTHPSYTPIAYPKPDGKLTFDRLSSVFVSNTNHEEDQRAHLTLKDANVPISVNLALYDAPEQRYCPAGVYEIVRDAAGRTRACRSTRRTACTARPATSRIRRRTSTGSCPRAAADRTIRTCSLHNDDSPELSED